ncbi:MAG: class I SAM-dependent methyltransferase [Pseudomonadota bacterium]|nr:class I SAM-dependent methyltransferase [Pseudomonadota bacterium]
MNVDAKKYWNSYYEEHAFATGKAPLDFLLKMQARMQKGRVLDVAMGEGINSVYLAQKGYKVDGFDISETACRRARELARDTGVELTIKCTDMDMYLLGIMQYDAVIMTYFKPSVLRYYPELIKSLKQGGTLLLESYHVDALEEAIPKEESYRDCYFNTNELLPNLRGMLLLYYHEGKVNGRQVVRCFAKKPIDRHAAKFDLFDMQTKQDKQGKSQQLELAEKLFKK